MFARKRDDVGIVPYELYLNLLRDRRAGACSRRFFYGTSRAPSPTVFFSCRYVVVGAGVPDRPKASLMEEGGICKANDGGS